MSRASVDVTHEWVVTWFPPDHPSKSRRFGSEDKAREFAASYDVAEWAPLLELRSITTTSTLVPL